MTTHVYGDHELLVDEACDCELFCVSQESPEEQRQCLEVVNKLLKYLKS